MSNAIRHALRRAAIFAAIVVASASGASAQSTEERRTVDAFRDSIAPLRDTVALRRLERVMIDAARQRRGVREIDMVHEDFGHSGGSLR